MRSTRWFTLLFLLLSSACFAEDPKNVLLICVDDLRPELNCYGVDYIQSPNIDALAADGMLFRKHYVQAPTCGASRYTLLTGRYGSGSNAALFQRADKLKENPDAVSPSMPSWFREHGYTTVSVGKVSHHPGGRGGPDWNDDALPEMPLSWDRHLLQAGAWQHPRGWMHGLADGEIRKNAKEMDVFQAVEGPDSRYPDGISTDEALRQLTQLSNDKSGKPFFLGFGILRPHLPFGAPAKYLEPYLDAELPAIPHPEKPSGTTTWHGSGEFMKYNRWGKNPNTDAAFALEVRRHYAACVTFADAQVGKILQKLDDLGQRENTIVVLWGDHGWHLGEHSIWGKHALFEESLRSPLIISSPGMKKAGTQTEAVVETLDIFPTLAELTGIPAPEFAQGVSLLPVMNGEDKAGHPAFSYKGDTKTIRTATHRLIAHPKGELELYDHRTPEGETKNLAKEDPALAQSLLKQIQERLETKSE